MTARRVSTVSIVRAALIAAIGTFVAWLTWQALETFREMSGEAAAFEQVEDDIDWLEEFRLG